MLNGQSYQVLIDYNLETPSGLTINFITGMLYWGDVGRIEGFDLMEMNRTTYNIIPDIVPSKITTIGELILFTVSERTRYGVFQVRTKFLTMISLESGSLVYGIAALSQLMEPTQGTYTDSNSNRKNWMSVYLPCFTTRPVFLLLQLIKLLTFL